MSGAAYCRPRQVLTPRRFAGPRQLDHADWLSRPWAFIDHCCRLLGWGAWPSALTNSYADLLTTASKAAAERLPTKLQSKRTTSMTRRLRRHGSRLPDTQHRYRREVHQRLQLLGLVRRGRGWVEPVDLTELVLRDALSRVEGVVTALSRHKRFSVELAEMSKILKDSDRKKRSCAKEGQTTVQFDGRRRNGRSQLRHGNGTFGPAPEIIGARSERPTLNQLMAKKIALPPCNPMATQAERSSAPPPTPDVSVAGAVAPAGKPPSPAPLTAAVRDAEGQLGVRVTPGAEAKHERVATQVAARVGLSDGVAAPDPVAMCRTPATRAQLLAAVPALRGQPALVAMLLAARVSLLAAHHAWEAAIRGSPPPGFNYAARVASAARRYQAGFAGEADGWCPYQAYLRQKGTRARRSPPRVGY